MAIGKTSIGSLIVNLVARTRQFQGGMKRAQVSLNNFARAAGRAGAALTAAGGIPLVMATREAANFEHQMSKVGTMLGQHSDKHLPELQRGIEKTAMAYGQSTDTLTDAVYDWLSAQQEVSQAIPALQAASRAAWAGFTETKTAMSAMITLMESYGDQLKDVTDASDFLFSVVKRGRLTFEELAQNLGDVAPAAANANVRIEELGAALAMITRGMPNTARAVTSLRNIITTFLKNTNDAKEAARKLGIQMDTQALQARGLFYVFQRLSKVDPQTVAKVFPRRRALRGLVVLLNKMSDAGVDLAAMYNRAGATGEAYSKVQDDLIVQASKLWETVKNLARAIGEEMIPSVQKAVKAMIDLGTRSAWLEAHLADLLKTIALIGSTMLIVAGSAKLIAFVLSPKGPWALAIIGVVMLADALGLINTGLVDMAANIEIAGSSITQHLTNTFLYAAQAAEMAWVAIKNVLSFGLVQESLEREMDAVKDRYEEMRKMAEDSNWEMTRSHNQQQEAIEKMRKELEKAQEKQEQMANDTIQGYEDAKDAAEDFGVATGKYNMGQQIQGPPMVEVQTERLRLTTQRAGAALMGTRAGFSAALPRFRGGGLKTERKVEKNTKQTARNTSDIVREMRRMNNQTQVTGLN